ncbi:hypothetical protein ACVISU_002089 [Bradyrhizobium sp. USDA 4452]
MATGSTALTPTLGTGRGRRRGVILSPERRRRPASQRSTRLPGASAIAARIADHGLHFGRTRLIFGLTPARCRPVRSADGAHLEAGLTGAAVRAAVRGLPSGSGFRCEPSQPDVTAPDVDCRAPSTPQGDLDFAAMPAKLVLTEYHRSWLPRSCRRLQAGRSEPLLYIGCGLRLSGLFKSGMLGLANRQFLSHRSEALRFVAEAFMEGLRLFETTTHDPWLPSVMRTPSPRSRPPTEGTAHGHQAVMGCKLSGRVESFYIVR